MKRFLLAGAAVAAMTINSQAADPAVYAPVDVWSGFFIGVQGGWNFGGLDGGFSASGSDQFYDEETDDFAIGLFYGRNWQFGSWVLGIDSSISYVGIEEEFEIVGADVDYEANFLGLSRAKVGIAADNFLFFVAGGVAITKWDVDFDLGGSVQNDDGFGFGWTAGAGVETKFAENWSARVEYIYYDIDDDLSFSGVDSADFDLSGSIVRGGVAYHF